MPNDNALISTMTLPDGSEIELKDAAARQSLSAKMEASLKGAANGVAELDVDGHVPVSQLPSSLDNIAEYTDFDSFPAIGEAGKIYIDKETNSIYRYDGTNGEYVPISSSGSSSLRKIPFSIAIADWIDDNGVYTAYITNQNFITASEEFIIYDSSIGTNLTGNLDAAKNGSTHAMVFTTNSLPTGVISGNIFSICNAGGNVAIELIDDVLSISKGGTGSTTASGAITALGAVGQSEKGVANGVAELDANGHVPTSQLPGFVDDVLEYSDYEHFPISGETGKLYVDISNNKTYRWSGSTYVEVSPSLALGETSSTAYRGDRGADAYAHAVTNKGSAFTSGLYKITTNSEGHVTDATAVAKSDITGLGIPAQDTTYTFTDNNPSLSWGTKSKVATVGGVDIHVTMPANPDTNTWRPVGTGATDAAAGNHTHGISIATDSGTNQLTMAANTKYKITAGGQSYIFTTPPDNNTTYSFSDKNATLAWGTKSTIATVGGVDIHVTMPANPDTNTWRPVGTGATDAAAGNHTHGLSLASSSGTSSISLAANTKYQLTAGGSTYIFTTPPDNNTTYSKLSQFTNDKNFINSITINGNNYATIGGGTVDIGSNYSTTSHTHATSIAASSGTNQLTLAASTKYSITAGGTSYIFTTPPNTTYSAATTSAAGLMSAADKTKLNGIANGATANVGTITGITMNGASKGTSGVVNLGTVLTGTVNTYSVGDATKNSTYIGSHSVKVGQFGNHIFVLTGLFCVGSSNVPDNTTVFTTPVGYRPGNQYVVHARTLNTNICPIILLWDTDGTIKTYTSGSYRVLKAAEWYSFNAVALG